MIEGQEGVGWDDWLALARAAEQHGFEALLRSGPLLARRRAGARPARAPPASTGSGSARSCRRSPSGRPRSWPSSH